MSGGYPIILGGDHAAFEIEHANTPPKERPDWPLPSFDARDWAEAFCKTSAAQTFRDHEGKATDEGWMQTWFANALMRGYDQRSSEIAWQPIKTAPKDEMFIWAAPKGDGKWSLGLAYRNVSGGWSDAYGGDAPQHATRWAPLPDPPEAS